jgi:hypothetical protein
MAEFMEKKSGLFVIITMIIVVMTQSCAHTNNLTKEGVNFDNNYKITYESLFKDDKYDEQNNNF